MPEDTQSKAAYKPDPNPLPKGHKRLPCGCVDDAGGLVSPCPQHHAEIVAACNEWEWGYEGHGYWGAQP